MSDDTVGTSRNDADLYDNALVEAVRDAGSDTTGFTYGVLDVLRALSGVVADVTGVTRYVVEAGAPRGVRVTAKTGSAAGLRSRADNGAPLTGSKRRAVDLGLPRLIQGRAEAFVRFLSGSHSGVIGLPLFETRALLRAAGLPLG